MRFDIMAAFILIINILVLSIFYCLRNIEGVNILFMVFHALGMILVSLACLYVLSVDKNFSIAKVLFAIVLISVIFPIVHVMSFFSYGSIIILIAISVISGVTTFLIFGKREDRTLSTDYWKNTEFLKKIKNPYFFSLLLIFLLGFCLRFLVFGLTPVPLGYDTPVYLDLANRAMDLSIYELFEKGFLFSGNAYLDNWNFASFLLGIFAKALGTLNIDLIFLSKVIIPFISALSIIPIFFLTKEITDNKEVALFSSLFFAILPAELLFCDLYKEIFGEFFVILSLYLFVKNAKRRSYLTLLLFFVSMFLLWKIAITAFGKAVLFLLAYLTYFLLTEKLCKRDLIIGSITALAGLSFFLFHGMPFELSPVKVVGAGFYTQYAFPIIALTNFTAFLIMIYYSFRIINKSSSKEESLAFSFSFPLFLSIFIYSFLISGLMSYRIFPSSALLNSFRFSLYMDIPLAIIAGLFIYKVKKIEKKNIKVIIIVVIMLFSVMDFALTACNYTTIHSNRLKPYINEQNYLMLDSFQYDTYENIYVCGNFSRSLENENFAVGNWIRYIIYAKTGKEPIFIESLEEVDTDKVCLVLDYDAKHINIRIYNHKKPFFQKVLKALPKKDSCVFG
jgi:hypothetical protein